MKLSKKIVILWGSVLFLYLVSLLFFSHKSASLPGIFNRVMQTLMFFISLFIYIKEPNRKNKFIFLNFLILFAFCLFQYFYDFVGSSIFPSEKFARHIFVQYFLMGFALFQSIAVVYLVFDVLFHDFRIYQKYLATFCAVGVFYVVFFYPFFSKPLYLYTTEEIKQWKSLNTVASASDHAMTAGELANRVTLHVWSSGVAVGDLYPEQNYKRIEELLPYLEGENWMVLLWKPLHLNMIYMNVFLIAMILIFFAYQYQKDPPQGAYIDKIMFLLLLFCSMDIVHYWGFIKSVEWGSLSELFNVGQYVTVLIEGMMVLFFGLRLRFITSVQGEFYETELAANPAKISRWRDWVDEIVLSNFFNLKLFNGRLFQDPSKE